MDWSRIIDAAEQVIVQRGGNKSDLAKVLDVRPQYLSDLRSGKSKNPGSDFTLTLINKLKLNPNWIQNGTGQIFITDLKMDDALILAKHKYNTEMSNYEFESKPPALVDDFQFFKFTAGKTIPIETNEEDQNSMTLLPLFGQPAAAGSGQEPNQLNTIEAYIPIVFEMLGGASPRNCGIIRVVGDSMTDMTLFNGDLAIFDRTQLDGDGVFVISIGNAVRVKRLEYRTIEQKIVISSENAKRYPSPEVLSYEQAQNLLCVHGKVICWMHRHPY